MDRIDVPAAPGPAATDAPERPLWTLLADRLARWTQAQRYLACFAAAVVVSIVGFYAMLAGLFVLNRLPSPPVSGTACIDEKLAWLKDHRDRLRSGVMAIGSSVTWRNLNFAALSGETRAAAGGIVNAGACFLRLNQTRYLTDFLLDHQPEVRTVIMVMSPRDFEGCSSTRTAFFERDTLSDYLYDSDSGLWLYFRNFRPTAFLRDVELLPIWRATNLVFDPDGAGPMTADVPRLLTPYDPEPACYAELKAMAQEMHERGVQFVVVTFPVMPAWAAKYDPSGASQAEFAATVRATLDGTGAVLVDGMNRYQAPTADFTDPLHFQWPATGSFTRFVWDEARKAGARLPP